MASIQAPGSLGERYADDEWAENMEEWCGLQRFELGVITQRHTPAMQSIYLLWRKKNKGKGRIAPHPRVGLYLLDIGKSVRERRRRLFLLPVRRVDKGEVIAWNEVCAKEKRLVWACATRCRSAR
jgi:hypothetical protein